MVSIVTLAMEDVAQRWFEEQRQRYFPAALNRIPAHLSLFHKLPGDGNTREVLAEGARGQQPFAMRVEGVRSMGRGVMYTLSSPELLELHRGLAAKFVNSLTPQDKQPLRPHVVVQNKVEPQEAKALFTRLQTELMPREVGAEGLLWREYLGGSWRLLESFEFEKPV